MIDDAEFSRLATLYLEGALDEGELDRLDHALAESPERVAEFNDVRLLAGLIHEHGRSDEAAGDLLEFPEARPLRSWRRRWMSAAALLAIGLVIGSIATSYLRDPPSPVGEPRRQLAAVGLNDGSFEMSHPGMLTGLPGEPGVWAGDPVAIVPRGEEGIEPCLGKSMLCFDPKALPAPAPAPTPPGPRRTTRWQIVDLADVDLGETPAVATLKARFNRSEGEETADAPCRVEIYCFGGEIDTAREQQESGTFLSAAIQNLFADANPETWEIAEASVRVPRDASFLVLGVSGVGMRSPQPFGGAGFAGHYADGVELKLLAAADEDDSNSH